MDNNTYVTYEEWDRERRKLKIHSTYPGIRIEHGEYESALIYGEYGAIIASWYYFDPTTSRSTGHQCIVKTPRTIAQFIGEQANHYIYNALMDGGAA